MVFTFGANTGGIHGAGAALYAYRNEGAVLGVGVGHKGNSYALPTKGVREHRGRTVVGSTLPLSEIKGYVNNFIQYAESHPELTFKITQIGCGHAGIFAGDIAPMFANAPSNCYFDSAWKTYLPNKTFWGTF